VIRLTLVVLLFVQETVESNSTPIDKVEQQILDLYRSLAHLNATDKDGFLASIHNSRSYLFVRERDWIPQTLLAPRVLDRITTPL
jgi:hypothetical protein